ANGTTVNQGTTATRFLRDFGVGSLLFNRDGHFMGEVSTINGNNQMIITPSAVATTGSNHTFRRAAASTGNVISGNFIGGQEPNCGGAPWTNTGNITVVGVAVNVGPGSSTLVENNTIRNITLSITGNNNPWFR